MKEKIVRNHTQNDIISTFLTDKRHGTIKTIKVNSSNPLELHSLKPYTNESETENNGRRIIPIDIYELVRRAREHT